MRHESRGSGFEALKNEQKQDRSGFSLSQITGDQKKERDTFRMIKKYLKKQGKKKGQHPG